MGSDPSVLIVTGFGLNCEAESACAWQRAGAQVAVMHLNDLLARPGELQRHGALMLIGGFSFGDHLGSGHVFAARLRHHLRDELLRFVENGGLVLGICNGFQIMVRLGLLPGLDSDFFTPRLALISNECGAFQNRWVTLRFEPNARCVFTRGLGRMEVPVRHGEGRLFCADKALVERMKSEGCIACRYIHPGTGEPTMQFPFNPNGSVGAIAGLCDPSGRVLGMMPHPEAFLFPENHPRWTERPDAPADGAGLAIFRNAVAHLRG